MTAMTSMARTAGANRILPSGKIPHPVGDPSRSLDEEFDWRREMLHQAIGLLADKMEEAAVN